MIFELSGKLIDKGKIVQSKNDFKKREFVIEKKEKTGGTEYIKFQLILDRCNLIEPFNINDEIRVFFNVRGKRWEKGDQVIYFTNLSAQRIEKVSEEETPGPPPPEFKAEDIPPAQEPDDDLPF